MLKNKKPYKLSWNPESNPEIEDRLHFLRLSDKQKWKYLMKLILSNYPASKDTVSFRKRIIEWT